MGVPHSKFLEKAYKRHGNKYRYDQVIYIDSYTKVSIVCPIHGEFNQTPAEHVRGKGCKECGSIKAGASNRERAMKLFEDKRVEIHGSKYDYSFVKYTYLNAKVEIICPLHGSFFQTPYHHISMQTGCPKCQQYGYQEDKSGFLYILTDGVTTKVGITNREVTQRLWKINGEAGKELKIHLAIKFQNGKVPKYVEKVLLQYLENKYERVTQKFDGHTECFVGVNLTSLVSQIIKTIGEVFSTI